MGRRGSIRGLFLDGNIIASIPSVIFTSRSKSGSREMERRRIRWNSADLKNVPTVITPEENFGGVTSVSVAGSSRLMSLDRRHRWNHIRNTSVKRQFRAAPFFFQCEKQERGDAKEGGDSWPLPLLSFFFVRVYSRQYVTRSKS